MEYSTYEPVLFIEEALLFFSPCKVFDLSYLLRTIREKLCNKFYVNIDYKSIPIKIVLSNHLCHCEWEVIIYIQAALPGLISSNLTDLYENLVTANYF